MNSRKFLYGILLGVAVEGSMVGMEGGSPEKARLGRVMVGVVQARDLYYASFKNSYANGGVKDIIELLDLEVLRPGGSWELDEPTDFPCERDFDNVTVLLKNLKNPDVSAALKRMVFRNEVTEEEVEELVERLRNEVQERFLRVCKIFKNKISCIKKMIGRKRSSPVTGRTTGNGFAGSPPKKRLRIR